MVDFLRKENENFFEWKYRLIKAKKQGLLELNWEQIRDELGLQCHPGTLRKEANGMIEVLEYYEKLALKNSPDKVKAEIEEQKRELRKERTKLQAYKSEVNKFEKAEARFELLLEEMLKMFQNMEPLKPIEHIPFDVKEHREGLALFSDWHYGAIVDTSFNVYDRDIAKQRIKKLVSKIIAYGKHNGIKVLHVAQLGDIISGFIHLTTRLFSDIDTVQQTIEVTDILANVLAKLCNEFPKVVYYNVIGNHGRTVPKKDEATIKDNFEYFICWYLRERLKAFDNLTIIEDREGLITTEIMGQQIALTHGNYERLNTAEGLTQMTGILFNQVIFGHYHHNFVKELGQYTELIMNSSLIGGDEYSMTMRKISKPAQKFLIYNEDGLENIYNIVLK